MKIEAFGKSDIGLKRERNEDNYWFDKNIGAAIVSDGIGGSAAGDLASDITVECFRKIICQRILEAKTLLHVKKLLADSIDLANQEILKIRKKDPLAAGMGATAVGACIWHDYFIFINIGDSRAYLIRDRTITQITKDHSVVEKLLIEGDISKDEAKHHPQHNLITRAIGDENGIKVDLFTLDIKPGDLFVLCSDGLTSMLSDSKILATINKMDTLEKTCINLIDQILTKGAPDNVTVILIKPIIIDGD